MLETLAGIAIVLLVIALAIAAIVLSIVRLARRLERKLGRLTRTLPKSRSTRRGPTTARPRARASPSKPASDRSTIPPAGPRPRAPGRVVRAAPEPKAQTRWMGPQTTLRLHELAIAEPMAYVAIDRRASGIGLDPSEIIGSLPVDPRGRAEVPEDSTSYARLTPPQRFAYLKWLNAGRAELADDGYLMLHFFGLERRALVEGLDLPAIVHEVCRVREMAARALAARDSGEAPGIAPAGSRRLVPYMRHSAAFLWTLVARRPDAFSDRDIKVLAMRTGSWSEEALVSALAWFARSLGPTAPAPSSATSGSSPSMPPAPSDTSAHLPAWMARIVAEQQPGARRSVVLERVWEQFQSLFEARYAERFGHGMPLRTAKRERTISYRPANPSMAALDTPVPDTLGIASQFEPLVHLWNACIDDLRGLARVGTAGASGAVPGAVTLAQWDAIPQDLRSGMENPFAAGLAQLAASSSDGKGHAIVDIASVVAAVRMMYQADRHTYSAAQCQMLARAVDQAGMAIEPDARITEVGMPKDAAVALVSTRIPIDATPEATTRYLAAACVLRLGAAVAMADGEAQDRELEPIAHELERAFSLSEHDHRRLHALMALLRAKGSSVRAVSKRLLASLSLDARRSVGRLLVAVASADGVVGQAERTALKSGFRALGLEAGELEAALASLTTRDQPPVTGPATGEAPPLVLDPEAIARIMAETKQVAEILAEAMRGDGKERSDKDLVQTSQPRGLNRTSGAPLAPLPASPQGARPGEALAAAPVGLSPRYAAFYAAMVERPAWPLDEASGVARSMGMMLAGAVEAVNDWSFERAGGPVLIEESGRLVIDAERLRQLQ